MDRAWAAALSAACLTLALSMPACSGHGTDPAGNPGVEPRNDTSGQCTGNCDATPPSIPKLTDTSGYGDITTYGDVKDPRPSAGGACNYGPTDILYFAAIQASRLPGDMQGQWRAGQNCGQCAEVRARTATGWKSTVVRIVDECPDANCGVDLGGAPARDLMGDKPGRYSGEWTFVPCDGHAGVGDGKAALWVKEGSNAWWSIVQIRYPAERVAGMRIKAVTAPAWMEMAWSKDAENFFAVPAAVLQDTAEYDLQASLPGDRFYALRCRGTALAKEKASLPLTLTP